MNSNIFNQSSMQTPNEEALKAIINSMQPKALLNILNQSLDLSTLLNDVGNGTANYDQDVNQVDKLANHVLRTNSTIDFIANKTFSIEQDISNQVSEFITLEAFRTNSAISLNLADSDEQNTDSDGSNEDVIFTSMKKKKT